MAKCEKETIFTNKYEGKKVEKFEPFDKDVRLWKTIFTDSSWILAYDVGNGWMAPASDFNSDILWNRINK